MHVCMNLMHEQIKKLPPPIKISFLATPHRIPNNCAFGYRSKFNYKQVNTIDLYSFYLYLLQI